MHTFSLPVPDELQEAPRAEATASRRLAAEIEAFAMAEAGTPMDLELDLEAAAVEQLFAGTVA